MTVVTNPARSPTEVDVEDVSPTEDFEDLQDLQDLPVDDNDNIEDPNQLYDDEQESDVTFVVGINGDTWRYPGHRHVLIATSPVFALMLNCKSDIIVIDYVDRRGFEQLLRFYYCEPTQLTSVTTARATLDTAHKFLCAPLAERCARRLDELLDAGVALEVLRDLRYLCAHLPGAASAPSLEAFGDDSAARALRKCSRWCDCLAHNVLLVIDDHADEALVDERLEEMPYEDLALIVRRDTLRVSSEMVLVEALARWATAVCKRNKRELTPANKRAALGELAYCPRYLLLEGATLDRALAYELLEPIERALVLARARHLRAPVPVGAEQEGLLRRWARPRPARPAALAVHLSTRSQPPPEEPQSSRLCVRRSKRPKTPAYNPDERDKKGCCASFCDGLLRCLICLFD